MSEITDQILEAFKQSVRAIEGAEVTHEAALREMELPEWLGSKPGCLLFPPGMGALCEALEGIPHLTIRECKWLASGEAYFVKTPEPELFQSHWMNRFPSEEGR